MRGLFQVHCIRWVRGQPFFYESVLGMPLEHPGSYLYTGRLRAVWPLGQSAQSCFGVNV